MSGRGKILQAIGLALICAGPVVAIWSLLADWIDPSRVALSLSDPSYRLCPVVFRLCQAYWCGALERR